MAYKSFGNLFKINESENSGRIIVNENTAADLGVKAREASKKAKAEPTQENHREAAKHHLAAYKQYKKSTANDSIHMASLEEHHKKFVEHRKAAGDEPEHVKHYNEAKESGEHSNYTMKPEDHEHTAKLYHKVADSRKKAGLKEEHVQAAHNMAKIHEKKAVAFRASEKAEKHPTKANHTAAAEAHEKINSNEHHDYAKSHRDDAKAAKN